jgi:hypothetical protein
VVAHPAEAGDRHHPATGHGSDVQATVDVSMQVVQIREGSLGPVVVRELEVSQVLFVQVRPLFML